MIARRTLLATAAAFALFAVLPAPAARAGEEPYITAKTLDLMNFLPPPPVAGSAEDMADRAAVVAAQKAAGPERVALAQHDAEETIYVMFDKVMGDKFKAEALPLTSKLFARLGESEDATIDPVKPAYGRVRPYLAAPEEIKAQVKASKSGSYPSGHTTRVTLSAIVLSAMVPEKRAEIWARADEYAWSRVVGGMHYPRDLDGGRRAGTAMAATAFADPKFQADFAAAKAELRAALGL
jgi:acid phosphatase (class A)